MDKHRMWGHVTRGGQYQVLGGAVYKGGESLADMAEVVVTRTGEGWCDLDVHTITDTINIREIVAEAVVQVAKGAMLKTGDQVVVYRGSDGKHWIRPVKDFYDGRFVKLDDNLQPLPASPSGEQYTSEEAREPKEKRK